MTIAKEIWISHFLLYKWCWNANIGRFFVHAGIYVSLRYFFPLDWVQCTVKCFICKILFKWTFRNVKQRYTFCMLKRKEMDLIWTRKYVVCLALVVQHFCVYVCVFVPVNVFSNGKRIIWTWLVYVLRRKWNKRPEAHLLW